jgi:hypothetical protein
VQVHWRPSIIINMATVEEYEGIPLEMKLRRAAHHEAGHIVVAAAMGLPLRPDGIVIDSVAQGLACYWKEPGENDACRESVIAATFAGFNAEEEFCQRHSLPVLDGFAKIFCEDYRYARGIICQLTYLSPTDNVFEIDQKLEAASRVAVLRHWLAIEAIAAQLLAKDWEPIKPLESGTVWSRETSAKYLTGEELVAALARFAIDARCRYE